MAPKWCQNGFKMGPKTVSASENGFQNYPKMGSKIVPKILPKRIQNGIQNDPQNVLKMGPGGVPGACRVLRAFCVILGSVFDLILDSKIDQKNDQKVIKKSVAKKRRKMKPKGDRNDPKSTKKTN